MARTPLKYQGKDVATCGLPDATDGMAVCVKCDVAYPRHYVTSRGLCHDCYQPIIAEAAERLGLEYPGAQSIRIISMRASNYAWSTHNQAYI